MTNKEAIIELKWVVKVYKAIIKHESEELDIDCEWMKHWKRVIDAVNIAISILEKEAAE